MMEALKMSRCCRKHQKNRQIYVCNNEKMHPRSRHFRNPLDYGQLSQLYPTLLPFVYVDSYGKSSIRLNDRRALYHLSKSILSFCYGLNFELPLESSSVANCSKNSENENDGSHDTNVKQLSFITQKLVNEQEGYSVDSDYRRDDDSSDFRSGEEISSPADNSTSYFSTKYDEKDDDFLIPAIPVRANYIHYLADLMLNDCHGITALPKSSAAGTEARSSNFLAHSVFPRTVYGSPSMPTISNASLEGNLVRRQDFPSAAISARLWCGGSYARKRKRGSGDAIDSSQELDTELGMQEEEANKKVRGNHMNGCGYARTASADSLKLNGSNMTIPSGPNIRVLDIGTGANCIYPLLGTAEYGWSFAGTDISVESLYWAQRNVSLNSLDGRIELRLQKHAENIFIGVLEALYPPFEELPTNSSPPPALDFFVASMCNPPFYSEHTQIQRNPVREATGRRTERFTEGGELQFIMKMVEESRSVFKQILWFTCMVAKHDDVKILKKQFGMEMMNLENRKTQAHEIDRFIKGVSLKPFNYRVHSTRNFGKAEENAEGGGDWTAKEAGKDGDRATNNAEELVHRAASNTKELQNGGLNRSTDDEGSFCYGSSFSGSSGARGATLTEFGCTQAESSSILRGTCGYPLSLPTEQLNEQNIKAKARGFAPFRNTSSLNLSTARNDEDISSSSVVPGYALRQAGFQPCTRGYRLFTLNQGKQTRWVLCWSFYTDEQRSQVMERLSNSSSDGDR